MKQTREQELEQAARLVKKILTDLTAYTLSAPKNDPAWGVIYDAIWAADMAHTRIVGVEQLHGEAARRRETGQRRKACGGCRA